ncbi:MAG: Unknown protein [uncultured Aureispira sp.]|uniref:Uncharacterized protein n=1 Tax=uncultured Aureispira sp. TaxID=1331704 RepID=A0A6S6U0N5_9BACT|nr:MAG: Unknown protein [uncultured Aureispira sp.]
MTFCLLPNAYCYEKEKASAVAKISCGESLSCQRTFFFDSFKRQKEDVKPANMALGRYLATNLNSLNEIYIITLLRGEPELSVATSRK